MTIGSLFEIELQLSNWISFVQLEKLLDLLSYGFLFDKDGTGVTHTNRIFAFRASVLRFGIHRFFIFLHEHVLFLLLVMRNIISPMI